MDPASGRGDEALPRATAVAGGRRIGSPALGPGCFVSTGRSLDQAIDRVKLAESLGYDSAYCTHINGRDSLTVLTAYALATERIRVGTGVIPIYTRTPASMAQVAATKREGPVAMHSGPPVLGG